MNVPQVSFIELANLVHDTLLYEIWHLVGHNQLLPCVSTALWYFHCFVKQEVTRSPYISLLNRLICISTINESVTTGMYPLHPEMSPLTFSMCMALVQDLYHICMYM